MSSISSVNGPVPACTTVDQLVTFALDVLPSLRLASGLYCFDREFGKDVARGESVRYSLMVALGLSRAHAAGWLPEVEVGGLLELCLARRAEFTPGDLGLALWAAARMERPATSTLLSQLSLTGTDDTSLSRLVGMEIAWLLIGLAVNVDGSPAAEETLRRVNEHLRRRRQAPCGLYYHDGATRLRRRLPNFATEIYTLLALTVVARCLNDDRSRRDAERLAGHLLRLQTPDGEWPWLFDADRAKVVERYEIYSVHQDAMAPMALLELTDLTGDETYASAAMKGLPWSTGQNELGWNFLDGGTRFAHRSIRRRSPWSRMAPGANGAAQLTTGHPIRLAASAVEVNTTCRPYHLGWILEAWAGRVGIPTWRANG